MKNFVTEKKSLIKVVAIVTFVGAFINYGIWTPHRSTPEGAIKAYLESVTTRYEMFSLKGPESNSSYTRYVADTYCAYNWRGSNQGRTDGKNTYFFDLKHSLFGWYVAAPNSGP